jgi:hypothetical protein
LWSNGASARTLDDYQTQLLHAFPGGEASIASPNTGANTPGMSVLAALAHEVGHVVWAENTIPSVGGSYDFNTLIGCAARDFFRGWDYNHRNQLRPKGRWRNFRDPERPNRPDRRNEGATLDHRDPPLFADLDSANPGTANTALFQLYQPAQPWASLFGAQTPNEDFVETYVMAVLTGRDPSSGTFNGLLKSLSINIPNIAGTAPDVPRDLVAMPTKKQILASKMSCIAYH